MNKHSYRYELIKNENGMFDNYVDMVYILTMEDSNRKEQYMKQINTYIPHKNILIQYNKGFKNCKKELNKQDTINDLNDAYYHAFLNALQQNYKNIIIFEDDFLFDHNINQFIVDYIGKFIKNNDYHIYHLGSIFHISIPTLSMHLKSYFLVSSHGVIYNRDYIYYYIKKYEKGLNKPNDMVWNDLNIIKYTYYKPLCFQIATETENSSNWILSSIIIKINKLLNLHKNYQPGYKIYNIISLIISFHLIYLFLNHKCFLGI
jgi:hypothetical protein